MPRRAACVAPTHPRLPPHHAGSLFAAVYQGLFLPNKTSFLLFLAAAPTAVGLLALPLVNRCEFVQRSEVEARTHVFSAEGRFVFTLQALGTLGVYLITGATFGSLYPLSQAARLTVTVGAGLLLLPLALIPYGSGGLLSHKAHLHHALSHYPDQEQDPNRSGSPTDGAPDEEQGSGGARVAAAGGGGEAALTQPLLGDGPEQEGNGSAAAAVDALDSLEPAVPDADAPQPPAAAAPSTAAAAAAVLRAKQLPVQLSPVECLRSKDWWLLFLVLCIGMGSGGRHEVEAGEAAGAAIWRLLQSPCPVARPKGPQRLHTPPRARPHAAQQPGSAGQSCDAGSVSTGDHARPCLCVQRVQLRRWLGRVMWVCGGSPVPRAHAAACTPG